MGQYRAVAVLVVIGAMGSFSASSTYAKAPSDIDPSDPLADGSFVIGNFLQVRMPTADARIAPGDDAPWRQRSAVGGAGQVTGERARKVAQ
jgi:hypothetical protein